MNFSTPQAAEYASALLAVRKLPKIEERGKKIEHLDSEEKKIWVMFLSLLIVGEMKFTLNQLGI